MPRLPQEATPAMQKKRGVVIWMRMAAFYSNIWMLSIQLTDGTV